MFQKTRKLSKNDKFVTGKTKICLFHVLSFFVKLILNFQLIVFISQVILSENLNNKKKWSNTENDEKVIYRQHATKLFSILRLYSNCFFQWFTHFKKAYTMMICKFLMGYQVLQSVICKYNYPPHKNSGLKLNINKRNTQINMKQSHWKAWNWWTFHNKTKALFTVPFLSFSVLLSSLYIPANLLTCQRCCHVKN